MLAERERLDELVLNEVVLLSTHREMCSTRSLTAWSIAAMLEEVCAR